MDGIFQICQYSTEAYQNRWVVKKPPTLLHLVPIFHREKKPNKKMRSLIRLGIKSNQAYAWSRTRMGGWAVAQSPIQGTTITIKRLKKRGYIPMMDTFNLISPNYQNSLFSFAELVLRPRFP
jgi:hypothetical protein